MSGELTSLEICAGAGGQALGLEQAGFTHEAVVELDAAACETLRRNRGDDWKVIEDDVANVDGRGFACVHLSSGGVPCPPFSIAGKQLGRDDERDLFPQPGLRLVEETGPRAVLLENVRGLAARRFDGYRTQVWSGWPAWATRPGGMWCRPASTGCPSSGPGSCWSRVRQPWAAWFRWPRPILVRRLRWAACWPT